MSNTFDPAQDLAYVATMPSADYRQSLEAIAPNITTIAEEQRMPSESWADAVVRILPALAATWQQKQLLQVQVERAKQGLPPLDANQIAAGVNVGLSQDTTRLVMWSVAGLFALVALPQLVKMFKR